jgi:hypothetical protein
MKRQSTLSMFQDGAPSRGDGEVLLHSLSMIARGNNKKEIHKEKVMNDVRQSVGLYKRYPLANDILAGALKRFVIFVLPNHSLQPNIHKKIIDTFIHLVENAHSKREE